VSFCTYLAQKLFFQPLRRQTEVPVIKFLHDFPRRIHLKLLSPRRATSKPEVHDVAKGFVGVRRFPFRLERRDALFFLVGQTRHLIGEGSLVVGRGKSHRTGAQIGFDNLHIHSHGCLLFLSRVLGIQSILGGVDDGLEDASVVVVNVDYS
jgi:hypothetical protein